MKVRLPQMHRFILLALTRGYRISSISTLQVLVDISPLGLKLDQEKSWYDIERVASTEIGGATHRPEEIEIHIRWWKHSRYKIKLSWTKSDNNNAGCTIYKND